MLKLTAKSPDTINELCSFLKGADINTKLIAGGTDLIIWINENAFCEGTIIDISNIESLKKISLDNDIITIGSGVTFSQIHNSEIIRKYFPALAQAAFSVGSTQIRNRATIGGNIANASPCADGVTPLMAFNAKVEIINSEGKKYFRKPGEIIQSPHKNNLNPDEVILNIQIPKPKHNTASAFAKIGHRKRVAISKLNACINLELDSNDRVLSSKLFLGAIGIKAFESKLISEIFNGNILSPNLYMNFGEMLTKQVDEAIPNRSSRHYKRYAIHGIADDLLSSVIKQKGCIK